MTTAIQAVSSAYIASIPPALRPIPQLAQRADALLIVPSVILSLGATSPLPITYNAAGLFESLTQVAGISQDASGATTTPAATANAVGTAIAAARGDGATTLVGDLAASINFSTPAAGFGFLNVSPTSLSLPAISAQALTALLAPDSNPASPGGAGTLTVNQTLARQMMIDLYSSDTGLNTASAASASGAMDILQGLPSNSTVQSIDSPPSADFRLSATALLDNTGTARSAAPAVVAAQAAATPAETTTATPAAAARGTAPAAVGNATATAVTASASGIPATATAVTASAGSASAAASALSNDFLMDSVARALANIERNPAYASTVAGLYMSAVVFHSQQASAALPNTADSVGPVTAVPNITAVKSVRR